MILVTGAGGTVGSEVVRQLKAAGTPFRAAYHSEDKARKARERAIDAVVVDYDKPDTLEQALSGVDVLFLLTAGGTTQIAQEESAVRTAKKAGTTHIVKLSAWGTETESFSFARIHRAGEKAIEDVVSLLPTIMFGDVSVDVFEIAFRVVREQNFEAHQSPSVLPVSSILP